MRCRYRPQVQHKVPNQKVSKESRKRKPLSRGVCIVQHENVPKSQVLENECANDNADETDDRTSVWQVVSHSAICIWF